MDQQFMDFVRNLDLQELEGERFRRLVRIAHAEGLCYYDVCLAGI